MNLSNLFTVLVVGYGLVSLIAAIAGMASDGVQGQLVLFVLAALALIASPWVPNRFLWLVVGLVGLHVAALWQGSTQDSFQWSHHATRAGVSVVILGIFLRIK